MFLRLLLLFTLIPLVDLTLLVGIATETNWVVTLAMIFVPGALGAWLARREGLRCLAEVRRRLLRGEVPGEPLFSGFLVIVAGALLITPGVITDLLGLVLLIPPIRRLVGRYLLRRLQAKFVVTHLGPAWRDRDDNPDTGRGNERILDVHVEDHERDRRD